MNEFNLSKTRIKNLKKNMDLVYNDLKFFVEGSPKDRDFLRKNTNPLVIHYLASCLSCVRSEELLKLFLKFNKIKRSLK